MKLVNFLIMKLNHLSTSMIKENVKSIRLHDMVGPNFDFKCPKKKGKILQAL